MLTLPIKKKWFDMILSGEKKEEYREINDYYRVRFCNLFPDLKIPLFCQSLEQNLLYSEMDIKKTLRPLLPCVRGELAQERKNGEQRNARNILY